MLGCCEFRNKMYTCSCWVSLFLYFCAPVFCYCFVNCKCNHRVYTHGWHTFRYDATGKIITIFWEHLLFNIREYAKVTKMPANYRSTLGWKLHTGDRLKIWSPHRHPMMIYQHTDPHSLAFLISDLITIQHYPKVGKSCVFPKRTLTCICIF